MTRAQTLLLAHASIVSGPGDAIKASLLQTLLATFCRDFSGALVEKRADVKTGRKIKDAFVALQV